MTLCDRAGFPSRGAGAILISGAAVAIDWFLLGVGAALLLAGWLLYWIAIQLAGGVLVGAGFLFLADGIAALGDVEPAVVPWLRGGAFVVGFLAGVWLFRFLETLLFFIIGAVAGGAAVVKAFALGREEGLDWAMNDAAFAFGVPGGGALCGMLAIWLRKALIAVASAGLGTLFVMHAADWPYQGLPLLALFPIGAAVQLGLTKRRRAEADDEEV